jgi:hypothetical protein
MTGRVRGRWSGYAPAIVLAFACAGCASGEQPPDEVGLAGGATLHGGRPIFCLPPQASADALTAGPYALCAEYRAGRIDRLEYASALEAYGELLVAMAALDALGAPNQPSASAAKTRAAIRGRLRQSPTLRALCLAPSMAPYGTLAACNLVAKPRAVAWCPDKQAAKIIVGD